MAGGLAAAQRKLPLQWVVSLVPLVAGCMMLGVAAAVAIEVRCAICIAVPELCTIHLGFRQPGILKPRSVSSMLKEACDAEVAAAALLRTCVAYTVDAQILRSHVP